MNPTLRRTVIAGLQKIAEQEAMRSEIASALELIDRAVQSSVSTSRTRGEALRRAQDMLTALKYGKPVRTQVVCDALWDVFRDQLEKFPVSEEEKFKTQLMAEYGRLRKRVSDTPIEKLLTALPQSLLNVSKSRLQQTYKKVLQLQEPLPRSAIFVGDKVDERAIRPIKHLLEKYPVQLRRIYMDALVDVGIPFDALYTIRRDILVNPSQPPEQLLPSIYHELAHAINGRQWFRVAAHPNLSPSELEKLTIVPELAAHTATLGYIKWLKRQYDHPSVVNAIRAGLLPVPDDDPKWQSLVRRGKIKIESAKKPLTPLELLGEKEPWIPELAPPRGLAWVWDRLKAFFGA